MSDKYFPAKPDDVTCHSCPYGQLVAGTIICGMRLT